MLFRKGEAGKVQRKWSEGGTAENRKGRGAAEWHVLGCEGFSQIMTDSSRVFRGPVIYE